MIVHHLYCVRISAAPLNHFKIYGAMFLGQYRPAIAAAEEMIATLHEELLTVRSPPMADWLEGFVSMKQHVLIRFGKWREIVKQALPDNRELFCVTTAMMRYAMSVAHGSETWKRRSARPPGSKRRCARCRRAATCPTTGVSTSSRSRAR